MNFGDGSEIGVVPALPLRHTCHMLTMSVVALKGGVGKTSVVLGLASAATVKGLASLVIDLDPQGNATSLLSTHPSETSAANVLADPSVATVEAALTACDWEIAPGEVDVMPSHPDLIGFDTWHGGPLQPKLAGALSFLEGYDLVLIDCPPSLGALTREALVASDLVLVVTTPSFFGSKGVERAIEEIGEIQRTLNPRLMLGGIIVNRVRSVAEEHDYRREELLDIYGRTTILQPVIPDRIAVQQAEGSGRPVHLVRTSGGREVAEIYDSYLETLLRKGHRVGA